MKIKSILRYLFIWQVVIIVVTLVGIKLLPLRGTYVGGKVLLYKTLPVLFSRANFDGNNYISISLNGYGYAQQAFFPLYPNLIQMIRQWFNPNEAWQFSISTIVGISISVVSFVLAVIYLVKLIEIDYSEKIARLTLLLLLIFPMSFYFTAVYTEGLFLLLLVTSFYFSRTKNWWLAGILAGLASYTRFVGIFIFPALLIELWQQQKRFKLVSYLPLLLAPLGLLAYMFWLKQTTGDPLAFLHSLTAYGEFRSPRVVLLYQVFWRYLKMLATVNRTDPLFYTIILEIATGGLFLVTSIYAFAKQRLSYAVFNLAAYLAPTLTGSFVSLPRYVLACFPSFVVLAVFFQSRPKLKKLYLVISGLLFVVFLAMFSAGYWVA